MVIEDLFRKLSYGELSNLSISSEGSGQISEDAQGKLISYTNDGLTRLYSRFIIRQKSLIIKEYAHIINYHLRPEFAESSNSEEPCKYILDSSYEKFTGDVLKILEVFHSNGRKIVLNDSESPYSMYTPTPDTLQVPYPLAGRAIGINYQSKHDMLETTGDKRLSQLIFLPTFLHEALQSYVAHKVYSHMNGQENLLKSQEYSANYESLCAEAEAKDLMNSTFATSYSKLEFRGFV